ncbi:AAA-domain-containing protein [Rickenella mellea]|uniref:AAA-domain-containing protein n=1 Tax=Rickenella mellea TaxID=50990 RepID=A0A4Y7QI86_9AGAM|nr:AAA-domain-containing protein [Rickenella mellea]
MQTQAFLRPTRSFLQRRAFLPHAPRNISSKAGPSKTATRSRTTSHTQKRSSSSVAPPPPAESQPDTTGDTQSDELSHVNDKAAAELEKPKRRTKSTKTASETQGSEPHPSKDSQPLPDGLNILWTPSPSSQSSDALPPPEIFQEALNNFLVSLHPQTQHRATYASSNSMTVEPTLGLYCPIEGGDYVIDETVQELARRTGADVVVLDAVQLAAGEWGKFGKPAASLQLPQNPLHFPFAPTRSTRPPSQAMEEEEGEEEVDFSQGIPSQMTLHVMAHGIPGRTNGRQALISSARSSPPSKAKVFFDELVNVPRLDDPESSSGSRVVRPRIIYVRDYPTLAASAPSWYPPLLSAVRQRRQGPMARPSSPISNAMTIVFGMTPSIVPPAGVSGMDNAGPPGLLGLIMSRPATPTIPGQTRPRATGGNPVAASGRHDWSEDEHAERARERRLRERLRKWERGDVSLHDELPRLPHTAGEGQMNGNAGPRQEIVVIGPGGMGPMNPSFAHALQARMGRGDEGEGGGASQFFRSSVVVPAVRSVAMERATRIERRREINELTMRMGVGAIGGVLGDVLEPPALSDGNKIAEAEDVTKEDMLRFDGTKMWDEWGAHVEAWPNVKDIADRAVGSVVASDGVVDISSSSRSSLEPTAIPWSAVVNAWAAQRSSRDVRKSWIQESSDKASKEQRDDDEQDRDADSEDAHQVDEVVQAVKQDPDLSPHEQRLLGCIVDAGSMPTSFSHVHLPPHTIDSVRTIVSLPLLHPSAFQQGILKQHSMTGCLLFGPPGTGKTLVVRALAKEAGCRMLTVSPSDVMDMYVGEGEKLVRSLFSLARRLSPCVIFLDEIDALFGARMSTRETGGAIAHRGIITEFMQEMDGLKTNKDTNVIVIGATNRPFDLDDAVLRRLPRRLLVDLPGEKERAAILKILLRDEALADDVDFYTLAKRTDMFSGSDLKHLCVSAALAAVKERVTVPWEVPQSNTDNLPASMAEQSIGSSPQHTPGSSAFASLSTEPEEIETQPQPPRTLRLHHFNQALKEIVPSSSESLGSLSALRKWNEEFGEGQKKKRKIMWGKGLFGFSEPGADTLQDGKVAEGYPGVAAISERNDGKR